MDLVYGVESKSKREEEHWKESPELIATSMIYAYAQSNLLISRRHYGMYSRVALLALNTIS